MEEQEMDILIPPPSMGNLGVELKGAGLKVGEGVDAKWLFRGLTLSLTPGRCIGIVGPNERKDPLLVVYGRNRPY